MKIKYPYRFKTEDEFIKEYGEQWRDNIDYGWDSGMDYLFGKEYEYTKQQIEEQTNIYYDLPEAIFDGHSDYRWTISWDMLTKNKPKVPNYHSRKIIR